MYIAAELIGVIADLYILHLFLQGMFAKKRRALWKWLCCYGLFAAVMIALAFVPNGSFLRMFCFAAGTLCLCKYLFEAKFWQGVFAGIGICAMSALVDVIMFLLLSKLGVNGTALMQYGNTRIIYIATAHILLAAFVMVVLLFTKRKRSAVTPPFLLVLSPGYVVSIILGCVFCIEAQKRGADLPFSYLLAALALLYMNILLIIYAERMKESTDRRREAELMQQHFALQEQYYASMYAEQNETRAMFHDINKYMLAMKALVGKQNSDEAARVLQEAQDVFDNLNTVIDVGNSVVNIILTEYQAITRTNNIDFSFDVSVPAELKLSASELYVLLGNTMDNAIEACKELPAEKRYLRMQLKQFHSIIFYQIENPYLLPHLDRKRGKNHGFGLQNARRIPEKYNGVFNVDISDEVFSVTARFNV